MFNPYSSCVFSSSSRMNFIQEIANQLGYLVEGRLQQEMPAVEKVDLGIGQIVGESPSARRTEDLVAATPDRKQRHPAGAKVLVDAWIHRRIGGVVAKQLELDLVVARPRQQRVVMMPGFRVYPRLVGDTGHVLPSGGIEGEKLP